MNELDIDRLRDDDPPEPGALDFAAVRSRARKLRARTLTQRGGIAATVVVAIAAVAVFTGTRRTGDSIRTIRSSDTETTGLPAGPATTLCYPDPFPSRTPPQSDRDVAVSGWPQDLPPLLVLAGNGDLWVIDNGRARAWSTGRTEGDAASAYVWARFAPDGTIYASRLVDGPEIALDHLDRPEHLAGTITLPFTVDPDAPDGYCPIDGYLATFAIGPEGLVLVRHTPGPIPHSCPPPVPTTPSTDPWRCASPEAIQFEVRHGDYNAKGVELADLFGGYGTVVSDSASSSAFAVVTGGSVSVLTPGGAPECCGGGQQGTAFALSPDGSRIAFSPDDRHLNLWQPPSTSDEGTALWTAPDAIDGLAWTGNWIVVSHGGTLTLVSIVDGSAHDLTGFAPGPVLSLDWSR